MLERFRSRYASLFIDMTGEDYACAVGFCLVYENRGALSYLRHTAGNRSTLVMIHGLDRVDYHHIGFQFFAMRDNLCRIGFGENIDIIALYPEALCPHGNLPDGFLARNIKHALALGDTAAYLKKQCRFAYAGLAREERDGACDYAAAEHAVKFAHAALCAHIFGEDKRIKLFRCGIAASREHQALCRFLLRACRGSFLIGLLDECIPCAAGWTSAQPFRALIVAFTANINRFLLH